MNPNHRTMTKPNAMRNLLIVLATTAASGLFAQSTSIAVNADGAAPDPSAMLDIDVSALPANAKKGLLIPRVNSTASVAGPVNGLIVYQTGAPAGFYYYDAGVWRLINNGATGWSLTGNDLGTLPNDYLGTTDAKPMIFRTNNVERMRIMANAPWAIGQVSGLERVDVAGAVRVQGTVTSTNVGTIRYQSYSAVQQAPPYGTVNYAHHEGYMGAATGWRKMENDYDKVCGAAYTQMSQASCANGSSEIPDNIPASQVTATTDALTTPWPNSTGIGKMRHQYLFLKNELDVELNQLSGNTTITHGICPGQDINSISFYKAATSGSLKTWTWQVSVFHVPYGTDDLSGGFQTNTDPSFSCAVGTSAFPANNTAGWYTINLTSPFVWDGVRNIVVEVCMNGSTVAGQGNIPVKYYTVPGTSPANQLTYSKNALAGGTCLNTGPACGATTTGGCGMDGSCTAFGSYGSSNLRPVVRFNGIVSSTTGSAVSGTGCYINITAGFIVEKTLLPTPWRQQSSPYYAYRGPGSVSVEDGVYDNGVKLNDQVFDQYFDGRVHPSDAEAAGDMHLLSMADMSEFIEVNRHLPTMKGRRAWNLEGGFSFGDLTNQLWSTTETQALYLTELNDQAHFLEALTTERPITAAEYSTMRSIVVGMDDLTEDQKNVLIKDLASRVMTDNQQH